MILILSVISILNSLELKSQTVVNILSNGYKLERSLFLHGKKIGVYNKKGRLIKLSTDDKTRQKIFLNQSNSLSNYGIMLKYPEVIYKDVCVIADIVKTMQEKTNNKRGIGNRGKTKIVVKEHFSEKGKTMGELLTDVMLEKAKQTIA